MESQDTQAGSFKALSSGPGPPTLDFGFLKCQVGFQGGAKPACRRPGRLEKMVSIQGPPPPRRGPEQLGLQGGAFWVRTVV